MKSADEIAADVNRLVEEHYYSAPHELKWAVTGYADGLSDGEQKLLRRHVLHRLEGEPTIVDVILASCLQVPESVPLLTAALSRESVTSQLSRAMMGVLARYPEEASKRAIERFIDSEQEQEALALLARMDFERAVPHLQRALSKEHLADSCLHIFAERKKSVGLARLATDLRDSLLQGRHRLRERLKEVLTSKAGDYNPFTPEELDVLLSTLDDVSPGG